MGRALLRRDSRRRARSIRAGRKLATYLRRKHQGAYAPPLASKGRDARMTSTLQTDPRRSPRAGASLPRTRPPLEMPVLFQLADLSSQQIKILTPVELPIPPAAPIPA